MSNGTEELVFTSEEERQNALLEIPDEPPPGANIDEWQAEQDEKVKKIVEAQISDKAASDTTPKVDKVDPPVKTEIETQQIQSVGDDDFVDFSTLGKVKRSELPENLRSYSNPQEMLKQAAHARRYANSAEEKIQKLEGQLAEFQANAVKVSDLQKQLDDMKTATEDARRSAQESPSMSPVKRNEFNNKLKEINARIEKLKEYGGEDVEALQSVMSGTVEVFKDTLAELDSVRNEFSGYRKTSESRYANLEKEIKNVSGMTIRAEEKRKAELEQKTAERNMEELQLRHPELKTSKPLNSADRDDLEAAIVRMAHKAYGRNPIRKTTDGNFDFSDLNKFVGLYNSKDPSLLKALDQDEIVPGHYGITANDIRNYGILINVYWRQRGMRVDPATGNIVPLVDWRGEKVTFPDFESAFQNIKESSGLTTAERELAIIEAEKNGQRNLDESLKKRDTALPTLEPTGAPPEGPGLSEEQALEIIGERTGRMTVDEEGMERLLRNGDKRGWDMFRALQKANETLGLPVPQPEPHWRNPPA